MTISNSWMVFVFVVCTCLLLFVVLFRRKDSTQLKNAIYELLPLFYFAYNYILC